MPPMVIFQKLWNEDEGLDVTEYAVIFAVLALVVVSTIRVISSN
jgi:Flp pilus assembly pilin Flp